MTQDKSDFFRNISISKENIKILSEAPNIEEIWGSYGLSSNTSPLIEELVEENLDKQWEFGEFGLSMNSAITTDFFDRHPDIDFHWGVYGISSNPNVDENFVLSNKDKPWDSSFYGLAMNPSIRQEVLDMFEKKEYLITAEDAKEFLDEFYKTEDPKSDGYISEYSDTQHMEISFGFGWEDIIPTPLPNPYNN